MSEIPLNVTVSGHRDIIGILKIRSITSLKSHKMIAFQIDRPVGFLRNESCSTFMQNCYHLYSAVVLALYATYPMPPHLE